MKKTLGIGGVLLAIELSTAIGCNGQTVYTDTVTTKPYVIVTPYLNNHKDIDSVYTMWLIDTKSTSSEGAATYELRSASGSVIEHGYFSINGDNYTVWENANESDKKTFQLLSVYLKNQPK